MVLPTDSQTEGIIITDAPLAYASDPVVESHGRLVSPLPSSPLTTSASPAASASRLISFSKVFCERWLWLTCAISLLLVVLAYQFLPDYETVFNAAIDNQYITPYSPTADLMRLGDGWMPPRQISPQEKGHSNSDGSYSVPASFLYTTGSGELQLYNFGYPLGFGSYNLEVNALGNVPMSYTVSIGDQTLGTYTALTQSYQLGNRPIVAVSSAAFLAAGPDPKITISISHASAPTSKSGTPSLYIPSINLSAPSPVVLVIPPLPLLLSTLLFTMLCYFVMRKTQSSAPHASVLMLRSLIPICYLLLFIMHLDHRRTMNTSLLWPLSLALLVLIIAWRRELANWVLHLRHPDDERFRMV